MTCHFKTGTGLKPGAARQGLVCPKCGGEGWTAHDAHCPECDGTGEVEEDPFYIGADLLYEEMKDREAE